MSLFLVSDGGTHDAHSTVGGRAQIPLTEVAAPEPIAPCPRETPPSILRSLRSQRQITASVPPATYSKRHAETVPVEDPGLNLAWVCRGGPDRVLKFMVTLPTSSLKIRWVSALACTRQLTFTICGCEHLPFG